MDTEKPADNSTPDETKTEPDTNQPMTAATGQTDDAPPAETGAMSDSEGDAPVPPPSPAEASPDELADDPVTSPPSPTTDSSPTMKQPSDKHNAPLAIIIAILVGLLLVGIGYAAFRASNDAENAPPPENTDTGENAEVNTGEVDNLEAEVDTLDQELEELEGDLSGADPSDANIGL
ncbi:MAG TPA: hypothetical protein VGA08_02305 [Candidatus Saccharimonadales bacterium]